MWSDNETTQDLLGYQVHADLLKKIILDKSMLPITIGVFGNWGSGKSSLMLQLHEGIAIWNNEQSQKDPEGEDGTNDKERVLQIKFNSWQFENYDATKLVMIDSILESIKTDISEHKDIFEKADDFFARISLLKAGVFILKKTYDNLTPDFIKKWLPNKKELDKITGRDTYNNLLEEIEKGNTSKFIGQFRELFEQMVKDAGYRAIVVYIDDLDRCNPKRIIECLEAVKLFVNVDRTAFVIGADERIIEYAIKQHYPIEQKKEEISSPFSDYLEKLIQLPYKLPRLSGNEQETYITLLLCKQYCRPMDFTSIYTNYVEFRKHDKHSKYNIDDIKRAFPTLNLSGVEYMLPIVPLIKSFLNGNPRQLKRFMNTLYVRMELARVAGFDELRPDILVKLMVLEYNSLYISRFEELYRMQRDNAGCLPIESAEEQAKAGEDIIDELWKNNWESDYLKRWLASTPSLLNINLQNYFWVARDALKTETPIATVVTRKVNLIFKGLCAIQTNSSMSKRLPESLKALEEDEKDMLILLLNEKLISKPDSAECWRILNDSAVDELLVNNIDRLNALFNNVKTLSIDPQASTFFVRIQNRQDNCAEFISKLPISQQLTNAINRKKR